MQIVKFESTTGLVGSGITRPIEALLYAVCKRSSRVDPYIVSNEYVAAELGRTLRLPIPPSCLTRDSHQALYFASLNCNLSGVSLPPIIPEQFCDTYPDAVGEIIAFDAFIANADRHDENMMVSDDLLSGFIIFDHSHALFGSVNYKQSGVARLKAAESAIVIDGKMDGNAHCLLPHIKDERSVYHMIERIAALPDYLIEGIAMDTVKLGLDRDQAMGLCEFLKMRKGKLADIVSACQGVFPVATQRCQP